MTHAPLFLSNGVEFSEAGSVGPRLLGSEHTHTFAESLAVQN